MIPQIAANLVMKSTEEIAPEHMKRRLQEKFPSSSCECLGEMMTMLQSEVKRLQKPKQTKREKRQKKKTKNEKETKSAYWKQADKLWTPQLSKMPYGDFLETGYWKIIRQIKLIESNQRCSKCNRTNFLQIHHTTYANRGSEHRFLWQLKVLCDGCHKDHHGAK